MVCLGVLLELNEYDFNYYKRGFFIIINNKNFYLFIGKELCEGIDVDVERLEEWF